MKDNKNTKNLNYMRQKMSKERMYELAMKKGVKADPKILELLKKMEEEHKLKKSLKDYADKEDQEAREKKVKDVREKVVVKTLAFGVAAFNQQDFDADLLRPLNSIVEPEQEFQLIDMTSYEDHDREAVNSLFKLYGKLFKTYFVIYSSGTKVVDKFTEEREQTITRSDLWSFLKDKRLEVNTNMEELADLVRQINLIHFNIRGDPNNLSYKGYKIFMLEIGALFFPSTIPMPPAFSLKRLLKYLESVDAFDEKISKIFENPEYAGADDLDLIEYLNTEVNKNPNMLLPETYSLHKRKIIDYEFKISKNLNMNDSFRVCTEILNDLISKCDKLDFDFIEPTPTVSDCYYVKPRIIFKDAFAKKLTSSVLQLSLGKLPIDVEKSKSYKGPREPHLISGSEKKLMFAKPLVELSTLMKYHVATYDFRDKATARDCALVLEELLQKTEAGMEPGETDYHLKIPVKITIENKLIREREKSQMKAERRAIQEHEEFLARDVEIKEQIKEAAKQKAIEEEKKRKEEAKKLKEQEAKRRTLEKAKKRAAAAAKKEIKKKEQKEKKIIEERDKRAKKRLADIDDRRKKKFLNFQEARVRAFKKEWRLKWLEFKQKQAHQDNVNQTWASNQKTENAAHLSAFMANKDDIQKQKEHDEVQFAKFMESSEAAAFKQKFMPSLKVVFDHYCRIGDHEIGHEECNSLMNKRELAKFCNHFSLYPVLTSPYGVNKWYSNVDLKEGIDKFGISLKQFEDFLLEACFRNREFLSKYYLDQLARHDNAIQDGSVSESMITQKEFIKKTDVGVMPSMRKKEKPSTKDLNQSAEDDKLSRKISARSKRGLSVGHNDSLAGAVSQEDSLAMNDENLEQQYDAFEGLMMYIGVSEDVPEMKHRVKEIYEHFHNTSPQKREMSKPSLNLRRQGFEEEGRHPY